MGCPSPTSARASTARGTQGLVAAAHSAMGEAVGRFAPYAETAVPPLEETTVCGLDPFNRGGMVALSIFPYHAIGWFDSATAAASAFPVAATAGAGRTFLGERGSARANWRRAYSPSEEEKH